MLKRTTISLNQDYLSFLKLLSLQEQKSLSQLVNEAVRAYLSNIEVKSDQQAFFDSLTKLKKELRLNKKELLKYIKKGRL